MNHRNHSTAESHGLQWKLSGNREEDGLGGRHRTLFQDSLQEWLCGYLLFNILRTLRYKTITRKVRAV